MRGKRYSNEQIIYALKRVEAEHAKTATWCRLIYCLNKTGLRTNRHRALQRNLPAKEPPRFAAYP